MSKITVTRRKKLDLDGLSIEAAVEYLTSMYHKHTDTAYISVSWDSEYDSTIGIVELVYQELETDAEYLARTEREKRGKEYRRKQYEQLKKEFCGE